MSCNSCKNISFDKRPTYAELMETPHLDFWFEEFEGRKDEDPNWEDGDNLMAVIHCYECGTTYKADGETIKGGPTKDDVEDYGKEYNIEDFKVVEEYDFSKKEVRDKYDKENQNKND